MANEPENPFEIDEGRLDWEWLRQARLSRAAGVREADAAHELAKAKARLGVVAAQVRADIRANPDEYDLPAKPTVDDLAAAVVMDSRHVEAQAVVNKAEHLVHLCKVDVAAMADRRRALERLVELLSIDYYAEPRAKSAGSYRARENAGKESARGPVRRQTEQP